MWNIFWEIYRCKLFFRECGEKGSEFQRNISPIYLNCVKYYKLPPMLRFGKEYRNETVCLLALIIISKVANNIRKEDLAGKLEL